MNRLSKHCEVVGFFRAFNVSELTVFFSMSHLFLWSWKGNLCTFSKDHVIGMPRRDQEHFFFSFFFFCCRPCCCLLRELAQRIQVHFGLAEPGQASITSSQSGGFLTDSSQQHHTPQAVPIIQTKYLTQNKKILLYYYVFKMSRLTQIYAKLL